MKKQLSLLLAPVIGISAQAQLVVGPAELSVKVLAETPYVVAARDGNQKTWSKVTWESNLFTRELTVRTNSFTELATGNAHLVNGVWVDSSDQIQITKTGARATNCQHQVAFLGNINTPGAIDMTLPEGDKHLVSSILGLSYMDGTGKSVLVAELKDSVGQLLPSGNQVLYPDAFTDISADVLYINSVSSFEQLIILRQQPPSPAEWGLDPETSVLQVITEFLNPPTPQITQRKLDGAVDEHLDFGITQMPKGVAFAWGNETNTIPVTKRWLLLDGRHCLVESTPFTLLKPLLKGLPGPPGQARLHDSPDAVLHKVASGHLLPVPKLASTGNSFLRLASSMPTQKGVVIDYATATSQTNFTFQADTTYYVSSNVTLSGTTVFEGGTVIKFTNSPGAGITMSGTFLVSTAPYKMAILTSKDDNSCGDTISGSSGSPTNYNGATFLLNGSGLYRYLRFCYAGIGISADARPSSLSFSHCQFSNCGTAIGSQDTDVDLHNILFANCGTALSFSKCDDTLRGEHVTADQITTFVNRSCDPGLLTNSILTAVTGSLTNIAFFNCTTNSSGAGIFQSVGAGNYYLVAGSTNRNTGTTNINATLLSDLKHKTTYPPILLTNNFTIDTILSPQVQLETGSPDLGFAYDPIDYITHAVTVTNCSLTVAEGTAIACYNESGIWLQEGSSISSIGTPCAPNWFTRYQSVQEQPLSLGAFTPASGINVASPHSGSPAPTAKYRFSRFSCPAGGGFHLYHDSSWAYSNLVVQDAEVWGGANKFAGSADSIATLQNNLFYRTTFPASIASTNSLSISNNLFWAATALSIKPLSSNRWAIYNNFFDSCSLSVLQGTVTNSGYNAYYNCNKQLTPTNASDIALTNAIAYQSGPLGDFYQLTNSPLVNMGSCTAGLAGLYHYTVTTNLVSGSEIKEASSAVDIGYHYIAVDSNGQPLDTDGDGISDYLADKNGNGLLDFGEIPFGITVENPANGSVINK